MSTHPFHKIAQNVFVSLLDELHVKHTRSFSNRYYDEHPYKNNLYGLSCMLSDYHIENEGLRIKDKEKLLPELEPPFIASVSSDFVTVSQILPERVTYIWRGETITVSVEEFIKIWSGVILYAEPDSDSIEPHYQANRKQELIARAGKMLLALVIVLLLGLSFFLTPVWQQAYKVIFLVFSILGLYISYLLLLKQMHIQSNSADKVCSLFLKKSDCNHLLDSEASKLWGIVSWSEIGLSYFAANILMLAFLPHLYSLMVWINIAALPFTVWSVWYQKFKAKQWCPLCLIVQLILWLLFLTNIVSGNISYPPLTLTNILWAGCIYILPVLLLKELIPYISDAKEKREVMQELNSLKANEEIFSRLLKTKRKYEVSESDSSLLLGNPDAKNTITIVTNPHCSPCAKMHERIKRLIKNASQDLCLQFVLTTFGKEQERISRLFIAAYQQLPPAEFVSFLDEWYHWGRYNETSFLQKHDFDKDSPSVLTEHQKHKDWINKTNIRATPTILFNGYELPGDKYRLDDLVLLKDVNIS